MLQSNQTKNDKFINSNHQEVITITKTEEMTKHRPTGSFYRSNRAEINRHTSDNHILRELSDVVEENRELHTELEQLRAQKAQLEALVVQDVKFPYLLNPRGAQEKFDTEVKMVQNVEGGVRSTDIETTNECEDQLYGTYVLFDADGLKGLNDVLNYSTGDKLLGIIAQAIDTYIHRQCDIKARLGGDEFAIFLQGKVDKLHAKLIITSIVDEIKQECDKLRSEFTLKYESDPKANQKYGEIGYFGVSIAVREVKKSTIENQQNAFSYLQDLCKPDLQKAKENNKAMAQSGHNLGAFDRETGRYQKKH